MYGKYSRAARRYGKKRARRGTWVRGAASRVIRKMGINRGIHRFKRTMVTFIPINTTTWGANIGCFANQGNTATATNTPFTLSSLPNYTEFTTLFDQYRITGLKHKFVLNGNSNELSSSTISLPNIHWVVDRDDATPLTSTATALEYDTLKIRRLDKPFSVFVRPKLATAVYQSGGFTAYAQDTSRLWVDASYADAQYYGSKWVVDTIGRANTSSYLTVYTTAYIECKDVR